MNMRFHREQYGHLLLYLFAAYMLFLVGFFYVPNAVDLYKYYSVAVFLPALFLVPKGAGLCLRNPLAGVILAYLAYMLLTPLWGDSFDSMAYLNYLRLALYVLVFLLLTVLLHWQWQDRFEEALAIVALLVATAGLVSLLLWYGDVITGPRLVGLGILVNPNPSAYAYGVFSLMNLGFALQREQTWPRRALHLIAFLVLGVYVFATYSRGGLLALLAGFAVLLLGRRSMAGYVVLLLVLASGVLMYLGYPSVISPLLRGIGLRPQIWADVIARIQEAPLLGHGYLSTQFVSFANRLFAHNAYLATLRDGGIVGGLLMLIMLGMALFQGWYVGRITGNYLYLALLVLALVCMMFDTDRLLTRPRELWVVLWFPMALVLGAYLRLRGRSVSR